MRIGGRELHVGGISLRGIKWRDRRLVPTAVLLVLLILLLVLFAQERSAAKRLDSLKAAETELAKGLGQYTSLRARVDELERRAALSPREGVNAAIDGVFGSTGLKGKLAGIRSVGQKDAGAYIREDAEVTVKSADLNEAVNVLYRIETAPMMLAVRRAELRTSFAAPALDMRLIVSMARKK